MAVTAAITGTQCVKLEYTHIMKLKNYEQLLGANSAAQDLITGASNSNLIPYLFEDVIGYEKHSPIKIIMFS